MVCQFFTGTWGRYFVDWLIGGGVGVGVGDEKKITLGNLILFETSYLIFLKWLRDCGHSSI